jgi:hypothetical protein
MSFSDDTQGIFVLAFLCNPNMRYEVRGRLENLPSPEDIISGAKPAPSVPEQEDRKTAMTTQQSERSQ